jgi:hypothetical protein
MRLLPINKLKSALSALKLIESFKHSHIGDTYDKIVYSVNNTGYALQRSNGAHTLVIEIADQIPGINQSICEYSYIQFLNTAKQSKELTLDTGLSFTITNGNISNLERIRELYDDNDVLPLNSALKRLGTQTKAVDFDNSIVLKLAIDSVLPFVSNEPSKQVLNLVEIRSDNQGYVSFTACDGSTLATYDVASQSSDKFNLTVYTKTLEILSKLLDKTTLEVGLEFTTDYLLFTVSNGNITYKLYSVIPDYGNFPTWQNLPILATKRNFVSSDIGIAELTIALELLKPEINQLPKDKVKQIKLHLSKESKIFIEHKQRDTDQTLNYADQKLEVSTDNDYIVGFGLASFKKVVTLIKKGRMKFTWDSDWNKRKKYYMYYEGTIVTIYNLPGLRVLLMPIVPVPNEREIEATA